jgi:hypothetical protein
MFMLIWVMNTDMINYELRKLLNYALAFRNKKKKPFITFKLFFCAVGICFFSIFHYFEFELVILWPKHIIPTNTASCALQDVVCGVKCWLNMRYCRWIIIELLINTVIRVTWLTPSQNNTGQVRHALSDW